MSSIVSSLADLVKSVFEVIYSFFETAGHLVLRTVDFVFQFFSSIVNVFLEFAKGLVDLAGGIVQFILGNLAVLAILALAGFGFLQYQRRQGNTVQVGNKKLN